MSLENRSGHLFRKLGPSLVGGVLFLAAGCTDKQEHKPSSVPIRPTPQIGYFRPSVAREETERVEATLARENPIRIVENVEVVETGLLNKEFFSNGDMMIWNSRVYPGIIDVFYKNEAGAWVQFNNIVPVVTTDAALSNAELDEAEIKNRVIKNEEGIMEVEMQFSRLNNGAHFKVIATLEEGKKEIAFRMEANEDSAKINTFGLGEYYGLRDKLRHFEIDGVVGDSTKEKSNPDGHFTLGTFIRKEVPQNGRIVMWGENSLKQFYQVNRPDLASDFAIEVRQETWRPEHKNIHPGFKNWLETAQINFSSKHMSEVEYRVGILENRRTKGVE